MTANRQGPDRAAELRRRAEAQLQRDGLDLPNLSPAEVQRLIFELRTHQIELELQNDELRRTQDELIESRDRYADLYDFAPVGYITLSSRGQILEANLTMADMLVVDRQTLLKSPLSDFIAVDDQDAFYHHNRRAAGAGRRATVRLSLVRSNGSVFWASLDSLALADGDDETGRLRVAVTDVDDRVQAEADRVSFERQMQHAQKLESLGVLAGGIAHDFNNLLMAILGNADLALGRISPSSTARDNIMNICKASRRAAELTNEMLAYSGKGQYVVKPIDLSELVREMSHLLEVSLPKKVTLSRDLDRGLPRFDGDAAQVRQVVMNLITNAAEAAAEGRGTVSLSTGVLDCDRTILDDLNEQVRLGQNEPLPEGRYVFLKVTDSGNGMNAEVIRKIFDPFFTTKFLGRGLGLSAVLGIIRGHQASLKVDSVLDEGTTVMVLFPANRTPEIPRLGGPQSAATSDWRGRGNLLVIDDDEAVCEVYKAMLERAGFDVLTAANGRGAMEVFTEPDREIACVLLDLTMPVMDGEEAFREMLRHDPEVKVLLASGYTELVAKRCFDGSGLAGFIQKPFDEATLIAKLRSILD